jgi:hypothetical protein
MNEHEQPTAWDKFSELFQTTFGSSPIEMGPQSSEEWDTLLRGLHDGDNAVVKSKRMFALMGLRKMGLVNASEVAAPVDGNGKANHKRDKPRAHKRRWRVQTAATDAEAFTHVHGHKELFTVRTGPPRIHPRARISR